MGSYSQHFMKGYNQLMFYITLPYKGLQGANTLAY